MAVPALPAKQNRNNGPFCAQETPLWCGLLKEKAEKRKNRADHPQIFRKNMAVPFFLSSVYNSYSNSSLVPFVWLAGSLSYYTERILQLHPFTRIGNRVLVAVKIALSPLPFPLLDQAQDAKTFQDSVHGFHTDPAQLSHRFPGRETGIGLIVPKFAETAVDHKLRRFEKKLKNAVGYFEEFPVLDRLTSFYLF